MVMHARKTPRISDGYFEKHQAHPYQNSSKYSKTTSSSSTAQQQQQLGGSSSTSSSSDHHRSYSDSHHHRLSRDSPNNGTYHSSHHHQHRGSGGGGGGSSAEGISPLLDDSGGRKGYGGGKIHSKEREIRDYKRDKYSDCSRSPKDSTLNSGGKQRSSRGPSSTSSSSTSTSALVNNDMSLVNTGCSSGGLLVDRDRTNHDRSSLLAVDQQMLADGGGKSKSGGSRGGKQQQGSGVHNNCLDKHSSNESRHSTSNTSISQSQSTGNSQSQSTIASASATTNTNAQSQSSGGGSSTSSSRVGDWSEHLSSSGKRYYYNCKTEVSQWEKPREWLLMDRESSNSQRLSVGESGRSDRGDRESGGSSRTADRDRSDGGRQYRDSRDSRDGGRDRGDGGGYNRGGSTRHTHDKHSNSRQSSSTNASASSTSASGDRQTSSSLTANNSTNSNNNAALATSGGSRSTSDKSHLHHHPSTSSSLAARQHCSGDSASRDSALDIGQKDTSGRLSRIGKVGGNYHHQQVQQQEVVQDMDISPGDSTPTSETSPSNPNQPTNAVMNSAVPTTAVLLANALPRLTSHPLTPSIANASGDLSSTATTTAPALSTATTTDLGATTSNVAMLEVSGASLQDGGATPTHSELPDVTRGESGQQLQQQQVIGINGGLVIMPGSSLQAVIPISNCSQLPPIATSSMITSLPTSCAASIVRSAASSSVVSGNHLVTASLAQHVRDDLLVHVRGWPADIIERQAIKCAEEAALVGGVQCARVSAELKTARAIVRLTEIQATLQEQRILFLRQQIKMLEELKSQNSFMSDDT